MPSICLATLHPYTLCIISSIFFVIVDAIYRISKPAFISIEVNLFMTDKLVKSLTSQTILHFLVKRYGLCPWVVNVENNEPSSSCKPIAQWILFIV